VNIYVHIDRQSSSRFYLASLFSFC